MTYLIAPGSLKAPAAAAFGEAFRKACERQDVGLKELERITRIGHTTLWHYLAGGILPKLDTAAVLAEVLHNPLLLEIVRKGRTGRCQNSRCGRSFINNGGAVKRFCNATCRDENDRVRRLGRKKGQITRDTAISDRRAYLGAINQAQGTVRQLSTDLRSARLAVEAMCRACESTGSCATPGCPLRTVSPFALRQAHHEAERRPRTNHEIRVGAWAPERRAAFVGQLHERWTPEAREAARSNPAILANLAEARKKGVVAVRRRSKASFSAASKLAWANRRSKAEATA